jgi:hypothetical protein
MHNSVDFFFHNLQAEDLRMRTKVNGRVVEIAVQSDDDSFSSDDLRRAVGIALDRPLIVQGQDGTSRLVNPGERLPVSSNPSFDEAPRHIRGSNTMPLSPA